MKIHIIILLFISTFLYGLNETQIIQYENLCSNNDGYSCFILGNDYDGNSNKQKSIKYLKKACDLEYIDAYPLLAKLYEEHEDIEKAIFYYKKSCDSGKGLYCSWIAAIYDSGKQNIKQNKKTANAFYTQACINNYSAGCVSLGYMYLNGIGAEKNIEYANDLFEEACLDGYNFGCSLYKQINSR